LREHTRYASQDHGHLLPKGGRYTSTVTLPLPYTTLHSSVIHSDFDILEDTHSIAHWILDNEAGGAQMCYKRIHDVPLKQSSEPGQQLFSSVLFDYHHIQLRAN